MSLTIAPAGVSVSLEPINRINHNSCIFAGVVYKEGSINYFLSSIII